MYMAYNSEKTKNRMFDITVFHYALLYNEWDQLLRMFLEGLVRLLSHYLPVLLCDHYSHDPERRSLVPYRSTVTT